jgi:hypothetical protein
MDTACLRPPHGNKKTTSAPSEVKYSGVVGTRESGYMLVSRLNEFKREKALIVWMVDVGANPMSLQRPHPAVGACEGNIRTVRRPSRPEI